MPHFWIIDDSNGWAVQPLAGESCLAVAAGHGLRLTPPSGMLGLADVRVQPPDPAGGAPLWTLLGGQEAALRVNGQPLALGIRALRDRDEISVAGQRCFFSTEELALVVPFPGMAQTVFCPRCKQKMEVGDPAVSCPHCRAWHHQSEKFPCWTYEPTCALCHVQSTALDAGYAWTPEML
jgi:Zn finger protein HypA/HybF involved in hydrogenase expression